MNSGGFDFDNDGKLTVRDVSLGLAFLLKNVLLGLLVGCVCGLIGGTFALCVEHAAGLRSEHGWLIYCLPVSGVLIVAMYHMFKDTADKGTNLILSSVAEGEHIPFRKAPEIFIATVLSHLCGASVGREGAALQLGGSIGYNIGALLRLDEKDKKMLTMSGMSAVFSALFGTPMAAAFFSIEVASVGMLNYSALVPCILAALSANKIAALMSVKGDAFAINIVPEFDMKTAFWAGILAVLCAVVSILFCILLHKSTHIAKKVVKNPYLRVIAGSAIIIALTFLAGNTLYNGAGMYVIELAIEGKSPMAAFFLKAVFTAISLGVGFKGGEIVPSLYIGATFGSAFAVLFGLNVPICTAIGMAALFCGVTNCPIASLLICFELFGYSGMPYYLLTIALSYGFSGYYSLYSSQKIVYSKIQNKILNRKTI